ncbi:MAG: ATP-binding protein [Prevotella sp.]|nr:ATP-binding protein [Prevotella sp.]
MNQELFSQLFRKGALVVLQKGDGQRVQGYVADCTDQGLCLTAADTADAQLWVTPDMVREATYLYAGFPTVQTEIDVPRMVTPNATIVSSQATMVQLRSAADGSVGNYLVSYIDPAMRMAAIHHPADLAGQRVLYVMFTDARSRLEIPHIIKAGTIDEAIENIVAMAAEGQVELALKFCEELLLQCPDDEELLGFISQLNEEQAASASQSATTAPQAIDFYAPTDEPGQWDLAAMGRIYDIGINRQGKLQGHIVDVASHQQLFFHKEQLLGPLAKMTKDELVGQPVVYTITRSPDGRGYQARTILPPLSIDDAYGLAEEMHYDYSSRLSLNAYDILRIIDSQFNEDDIEDALSEWRDNYVRDNLWDVATPLPYKGAPASLFLPTRPTDEPAPVNGVTLEHRQPHTEKVLSGEYLPPDVPTILLHKDEILEEEELIQPEEPEVPEEPEAPEEPVTMQELLYDEDELQPEPLPSIDFSDQDIANSLFADRVVEPNASITYSYGKGVVHIIDGDDQQEYRFLLDDIIDDDLYALVRQRSNSTNHVRNYPVVCQHRPFEQRVDYICESCTVAQMLRKAKATYERALRMHEESDDDNDLMEYLRALGFVENAIAAAPANNVALALKAAIENSIDTDDDNSYKAPREAIKPHGRIWNVNLWNNRITIKDERFINNLRLVNDDIADLNYPTLRQGDELLYAVYFDENSQNRLARFATLARTEDELLQMAGTRLSDGETVLAWALAHQVVDANPQNERACQMMAQCEAETDASGQPVVTEQLKTGWNQPVHTDLFASARQHLRKKEPREALRELLQKLRQLGIDDPRNTHQGSIVIIQILQIYHQLFAANPDDPDLRREYKQFGERCVMGKGFGQGFVLSDQRSLDNVRWIIQYHTDMGNTDDLIRAYRRQSTLLSMDKEMNADERTEKVSQVNANMAWIYVKNRQNPDVAKTYAQNALEGNPHNELARICLAVLKGRLKSRQKEGEPEKGFRSRELISLRKWMDLVSMNDAGWPGYNLTVKRYGLLCAIIQTTDEDRLQRLLAQYLSTLIYSEGQYANELKANVGLPADCWFIQQLLECTAKEPAWAGWADVRLVAMLSGNAADFLCSNLFDLDQTLACGILTASGIEVAHQPQDVNKNYYRKCFDQWRGSDYKNRFVELLNQTDRLNASHDLSACADFFRDLKFLPWMQQDDGEVILSLHRQLPDLLSRYTTADNARKLITLRQRIKDDVDNWIAQIERKPTVLALTAFHQLLGNIKVWVEELFAAKQFTQPCPSARLLQASAINADGSMTLEVEVSNAQPFAMQMNNCQLRVDNAEHELKAIMPPLTYDDASTVYGGEKLIYIIKIKTGPSLREQPNGVLRLSLSYTTKGSTPEAPTLEVPFSITTAFKTIEDQYGAGGIAFNDFYGREDDIHKVLSLLVQKRGLPHFIIYGQKRCGKSSILHYIKERVSQTDYLKEEFGYEGKFLCIGIDFLGYINEIASENDVYYKLWTNICMELMVSNWDAEDDPERDVLPESLFEEPQPEKVDFDHFVGFLTRIKKTFEKTRGWSDYKLLLFIDEFTSVLQWLQKKIIEQGFMQRWKVLQTRQLFAAILIGQDVLDSFKRDFGAANALQGFDGLIHLNYLDRTAGRQLVTIPMIRATGNNDIFLEGAVDRILYYSASSPFYTRWICTAIVAYMNMNRLSQISTADVECALRNRIASNAPSANEMLFNPLTYPGQDLSESDFKEEHTIAILDKVASAEWTDREMGCNKAVLATRTESPVASIVQNLIERMVLVENGDYYNLKVKLYMLWTQKRMFGTV